MNISIIEAPMGSSTTMFSLYMTYRLRQYWALQECLVNLASKRQELDEVIFLKLLDNFNHKLYDTIWPWEDDSSHVSSGYLNLLRSYWRHMPKKPLKCDIVWKVDL